MANSTTLASRIALNATSKRERPFLFLYDQAEAIQTFSYEVVAQRSLAWAWHYIDSGLGPRATIAIILQHSVDLYAAFLGAILANFVPAIFCPPTPKQEPKPYFRNLAHLLELATPDAIVADSTLESRLLAIIRDVTPSSRLIRFPNSEAHAAAFPPSNADPFDVAFVQYSSGTTGFKKAVGITHHAALSQISRYAEAIDLAEDDKIATWLPLYHDMGLIACMLLPIITGTPIVALSPFAWAFRPILLLKAITTHRATLCWMPNFAFNFLAKSICDEDLCDVDLTSMRGFVNCSERIMAESLDLFVRRFARYGLKAQSLKACYALAENTFAVTSGGFGAPLAIDSVRRAAFASGVAQPANAGDSQAVRLVSSGVPLAETHVWIKTNDGVRARDRHIGEIVISSPCLFTGYVGVSSSGPPEGQFATGDLGYVADGQLFVTGRKSDLIIVAGRNIYPEDVEAIVNDVPGVIPGRSVAFGLVNALAGTESLIVIAETHEAWAQERRSIAAAIRAQVAAEVTVAVDDVRLVSHMWLIKSSSGKLSRGANRERYLSILAVQEDATDDDAARTHEIRTIDQMSMAAEELEVALSAIWRRVLKTSAIVGADELEILGGSSLLAAQLHSEMEREFQAPVPLVVFLRARTVRELAIQLREVGWSPAVTRHNGKD